MKIVFGCLSEYNSGKYGKREDEPLELYNREKEILGMTKKGSEFLFLFPQKAGNRL